MSEPEDAAGLFARGAWEQSAQWEPPDPAALEIPGVHDLTLAGRGGMGAVYQAVQTSLERVVAVKILPGLITDVLTRERFIREARILATLEHPHILRIIDFGETNAGILFLVMEWASGGDLQDRLQQELPSTRQVLDWIGQVAEGLDFAHRAGVIHRDLKPGNLLLDRHGKIKIGDFGLAHAAGPGFTTGLTLSGSTLGTLDYMAPEQFTEGGILTPRTDVYALGILTYQMLTGRVPKGSFQPASRLAKVPRAVDMVIARALAQDPLHRFETPGKYYAALVAALRPRRPGWILLAAVVAACAASYLAWPKPEPKITPVPTPEAAQNTPQPVAEPTTIPTPAATPAATATPAPSARPIPSPNWQALIPAIQPYRDTRSGRWRQTPDGIISNSERCILALPAQAGENYDIRIRFTRLSGRHSVVVFLPTASGPATFELDAWEQQLGGLQDIDGNDMRAAGNTFPATIPNGVPQELLLEVRREQVRCNWNGRTATWPIAGRKLSINPLWQSDPVALPGIGSWESPTAFHSVELRNRVAQD